MGIGIKTQFPQQLMQINTPTFIRFIEPITVKYTLLCKLHKNLTDRFQVIGNFNAIIQQQFSRSKVKVTCYRNSNRM